MCPVVEVGCGFVLVVEVWEVAVSGKQNKTKASEPALGGHWRKEASLMEH